MPTPDTKLLQGTLDMLILKALSLGPLHGYGIGQRIMQMSEDALRVEEGSLYPTLYRIERQGWITAEWRRVPACRPRAQRKNARSSCHSFSFT
jgi:PadR family transcriptional regulator, regulatory protein PadR